MASLNKLEIIGHLGGDPILRMTEGGTQVASFSVAATEQWTTKAGEKKEKTVWVKASAWGKLSEVCGMYLRKGAQVYIEGPVDLSQYTNKNGEPGASLEMRVNRMLMLGKKPEGGTPPLAGYTKPAAAAHEAEPNVADAMDDESAPF